jgi:ribosome-binding protein aMBF1 (putative translation factor)
MNAAKRTRLKKAGWQIGSAADFLGLSVQEAALIEMKLALARDLQKRRQTSGITQVQLAKRLETSQSRVAKMESADGSVTLDLLVRALLALGATPKALARTLGTKRAA